MRFNICIKHIGHVYLMCVPFEKNKIPLFQMQFMCTSILMSFIFISYNNVYIYYYIRIVVEMLFSL